MKEYERCSTFTEPARHPQVPSNSKSNSEAFVNVKHVDGLKPNNSHCLLFLYALFIRLLETMQPNLIPDTQIYEIKSLCLHKY